jgi:hypothetical protein
MILLSMIRPKTIASLVRAVRAVGAGLKLNFHSAAATHAAPALPESDPVSKVAEDPVPYRFTRKR